VTIDFPNVQVLVDTSGQSIWDW